MRKFYLIPTFLALIAALNLTTCTRRPEWTTHSLEALHEFEQGLEAEMKYYRAEAKEHFKAAIELDPTFTACRVALFHHSGHGEERDQLGRQLRDTDTSRLNARERFLVEYTLLREGREVQGARDRLDSYIEANPKDPYGLSLRADNAWESGSLDEAEIYYKRLLEADPNWVSAQNRLGYAAMAQGRFAEAEELFETYKFIAPDQANPHDSLGEMLTLIGRYEEAEASLRRAVEVKPDFCASYRHLVELEILQGTPEAIDELFPSIDGNCSDEYPEHIRCTVTLWKDFYAGDFDAPWWENRQKCTELLGPREYLIHQMASLGGRTDKALDVEKAIREMIGEHETGEAYSMKFPRGLLLHMEGTRLAAGGQAEAAVTALQKADRYLVYWGEGQGILKMVNQLALARVLEELGQHDAAVAAAEQVRTVNPRFEEFYTRLWRSRTNRDSS